MKEARKRETEYNWETHIKLRMRSIGLEDGEYENGLQWKLETKTCAKG
jgi:predicted ATP-dependent Lon-type protease